MNITKVLIFSILIVIHTMVFAEEAPLYEDFSSNKIAAFTCSLINNGEYYRAYVELLRLKSYYPQHISAPVFDITANYLFYKSKKYDYLLDYTPSNPDDSVLIPLSLYRIDSLIKLRRLNEADTELTRLYGLSGPEKYQGYLTKRALYLSIMMNKKNDVKSDDNFSEYGDLIDYSVTVNSNRKNPYYGALAGIIPGMGYVYAGETGTGIVSMIIIGAGSAITYASYANNLDTLSAITGLITFFFYGGSIAGGYMQSVRFNKNLQQSLEMRLNRELMPERDLEEIYFKFGLNSNDCK